MFRPLTPGQGPVEGSLHKLSPGVCAEQFNLDIQRELPWGIFVDAAYRRFPRCAFAESDSDWNRPDSRSGLALQGALVAQVPNPFIGITTVSPLNPTTNPTVNAGQLLRPYPNIRMSASPGTAAAIATTILFNSPSRSASIVAAPSLLRTPTLS